MSKTTIIARMRREDGVAGVVKVLPAGTERLFPDTPMRPMGEAEVVAAVARDPDAPPFTPEELARADGFRAPRPCAERSGSRRKNLPRAIASRSAPCVIGNKAAPSPTSPRAYLTVIAHDPEGVRRALEAKLGLTMPAPKLAETTADSCRRVRAARDEFGDDT